MKVGCRSVALAAAAMVGMLAMGATAHAQNKCTSGKAKLAGKYSAALGGCYAKGAGKGGDVDVQALGCRQKAHDKFVAGSQKIDLKQDPAKPETVCPAGGGDDTAVNGFVTTHALAIATQLDPGAPSTFTASKCSAGKIKCAGKTDAALLGCYSKALGKGPAANLGTSVETFAAGCVQKAKDKLQACYDKLDLKQDPSPGKETSVCPQGSGDDGTKAMGLQFVGDIAGFYAEKLNSHRCKGDSSIACNVDGDCGGNAPCAFFFGTNLPLAAGGVSTCVVNTFSGGISGTANVDNGSSAGSAALLSRVYSGPTLSEPCPVCSGDPIPNDGSKGGTCSSGARSGLTCDGSGSHAIFGVTSLDCPPLAGGLIANLNIDLTNTTGNRTKTLTAANPNCRAVGFTGLKCQCDTCDNAAATPCSSNADCVAVGATICGGKRCTGGANNGAACSNNTECPGGNCGVPGAATASNQCDDATCSPDGGNEGTCAGGPFEQFCGPRETFRGCLGDGDCTFPGDTCSVGRNRDCFTDNGAIGNTDTATGIADNPGGDHAADSTLASLFCIGPTASSAVNGAAGLPGLGRLELQGHSFDNGDATTCPTKITFTGISQGGVLDSGWTGNGHDAQVISQGLVTVSVTGCAGSPGSCGVCSYVGPIAN